MKVKWSFNNCSKDIRHQIRSYWERKHQRIERLASNLPANANNIRITVSFYPERIKPCYIRAVFPVPGKTITVKNIEKVLNAALDKIADSLASSIRKYKSRIKKEIRKSTGADYSTDFSTVLPMLTRNKKDNQKEEFISTLRHMIPFLEERARKELKILEFENVITPDYLYAEELADDVVMLAWENFSEKPRDVSMENWLTGLMREHLKTVIDFHINNYKTALCG